MTELTVCPTEITEVTRLQTVMTPPESPVFLRRSRHPLSPRAWRLMFSEMTAAEKQQLEQIDDETAGGAGKFEWTTPEGALIDVRQVGPLAFTASGPNFYSTEIVIAALRPQD